MARVEIVFETHATTEDNERGVATGWLPGRLSAAGRDQARALGERRRDVDTVFCSDLGRARETAAIAFEGTDLPVLFDWRLRECDYGSRNGTPVADLHAERDRHVDAPYPDGESWRQAIDRVGGFVDDLPTRWDDRRVLVIGHVATRWAFDHLLGGVDVEELVNEDFAWRPGWTYRVET